MKYHTFSKLFWSKTTKFKVILARSGILILGL